jgi:hypothetical protein
MGARDETEMGCQERLRSAVRGSMPIRPREASDRRFRCPTPRPALAREPFFLLAVCLAAAGLVFLRALAFLAAVRLAFFRGPLPLRGGSRSPECAARP